MKESIDETLEMQDVSYEVFRQFYLKPNQIAPISKFIPFQTFLFKIMTIVYK